MSKRIRLTKGKYAIVDDEDYDELIKFRWTAMQKRNTWYARRSKYQNGGGYISIQMHRFILGLKYEDGKIVDHKDGDGLNNQKINIRICTRSQNSMNKKSSGNSKYLGVHKRVLWVKRLPTGHTVTSEHWIATIKVKQKIKRLGAFRVESDAALAYNKAALKYHKEFANLNKL